MWQTLTELRSQQKCRSLRQSQKPSTVWSSTRAFQQHARISCAPSAELDGKNLQHDIARTKQLIINKIVLYNIDNTPTCFERQRGV
mgnify:CR=1 FL=1